jgi:HPt (histidine-containing phosphotransfer) domain-containing protein
MHAPAGQSPDGSLGDDLDNGLAALDDLLALGADTGVDLELPLDVVGSSVAASVLPPAPAASLPAPAAPGVDAKRQALQEKMLQVFKDDAPKRLAVTETAIAAGDWDTAAIVVHGIKGSAAYIWPGGDIYELSKKLEILADDRQTDEFVLHFARLKELVAELVAQ